MFTQVVSKQLGTLVSVGMSDAYTDFVLSRQAMQCTKATLEFYRHTAAKFLAWAETQGASEPKQVTAFLVRQYLARLAEKVKADTTLYGNARAIRTLLKTLAKTLVSLFNGVKNAVDHANPSLFGLVATFLPFALPLPVAVMTAFSAQHFFNWEAWAENVLRQRKNVSEWHRTLPTLRVTL